MKFFMFHDTGYSTNKDSVKVRWSIDDGTTWSDGMVGFARYDLANGWQEHTVTLTGTQAQANVKVCFDGVSGYGNNIFIDDVSIFVPENMTWASCTSAQSNIGWLLPFWWICC